MVRFFTRNRVYLPFDRLIMTESRRSLSFSVYPLTGLVVIKAEKKSFVAKISRQILNVSQGSRFAELKVGIFKRLLLFVCLYPVCVREETDTFQI